MSYYTKGKAISLEEINEHSFYPPAFEIGRALEHYRKTKRKPFPSLMKTKFLYSLHEVGEVMTDEGMDIEDDTLTEVILCDLDGNELQKYEFWTRKKRMIVV